MVMMRDRPNAALIRSKALAFTLSRSPHVRPEIAGRSFVHYDF